MTTALGPTDSDAFLRDRRTCTWIYRVLVRLANDRDLTFSVVLRDAASRLGFVGAPCLNLKVLLAELSVTDDDLVACVVFAGRQSHPVQEDIAAFHNVLIAAVDEQQRRLVS